jgi:hypothetical protein
LLLRVEPFTPGLEDQLEESWNSDLYLMDLNFSEELMSGLLVIQARKRKMVALNTIYMQNGNVKVGDISVFSVTQVNQR